MSFDCCRYCVAPKRHPGCHATCPDYKEAKAEENKRKAYLQPHVADKYIYRNCEKNANMHQVFQKDFRQKVGRGAGHK